MARTVASLIGGRAREGAPGGTLEIANPTRLVDVVGVRVEVSDRDRPVGTEGPLRPLPGGRLAVAAAARGQRDENDEDHAPDADVVLDGC